MKILVLTSEPPYPPLNGVRIKTYHLLRGLFERGHEIHLVSFAEASDCFELGIVKELEKYCVGVKSFQLCDDPKYLVKNVISNLYSKDVINFRFQSKGFQKLLASTVKDEAIDIVHFDMVSLTHYLKSVDGIVPSIASINDSYSLWLRGKLSRAPYSTLNSVLEKAYYTITFPVATVYEKSTYENFQKVHVVSPIDATYLRCLNPNIDVEVIPNGVDVEYFKPLGLPQNDLSLVFVANMAGESAFNALWFIRNVFAEVKREIPNIRSYLVGKDPDRALLSEANRTEGVIVTGYVKDVRPYFDRATLVIDPTVKQGGILNHVLQAMAMGKPVVGTKFSFLAIEGARSWKNVVIANDANDFASKIIHLLRNEDERKVIGANARRLIESRYTWTKIVPRYEEMYNQAIVKFESQRSQ